MIVYKAGKQARDGSAMTAYKDDSISVRIKGGEHTYSRNKDLLLTNGIAGSEDSIWKSP